MTWRWMVWVCVSVLGMASAGALVTGCGEEVTAPTLLPVGPQVVKVNQQLTVDLQVSNPSGVALRYGFEAPTLLNIEQHASISGDARGGRFQYTPLVSHVGTHEVVFVVSSEAGEARQGVLLTVSAAASDAPIFLQPVPGSGGVYDLSKDPCVALDVEVRDDDTAAVAIRAHEALPTGATLTTRGDKSARLDWCPSAQQVATARTWPVVLEADDGEHPPVVLRYTVTLRGGTGGAECPGEGPVVEVTTPAQGAKVGGASGYRVVATVTDDKGLSEAPLLLYSEQAPQDLNAPDLTRFTALAMAPGASASEWVGVIPPLGLADGEERGLYVVVSATDDDDPRGVACDHTTEAGVVAFIATAAAGQKAAACEPCAADAGCETGLCVQGESGRVCAPGCSAQNPCAVGECAQVTTVDGLSASACGPLAVACGGSACVNDDLEPNESLSDAPPLAEGGAGVSGMICPADRDVFALSGAGSARVSLAGAGMGLDLYNADGELLCYGRQAGSSSLEVCLVSGEEAFAMVSGADASASGGYTLSRAAGSASACCGGDANEPNNRWATAAAVTNGDFDGRLCPCDADFFRVSAGAGEALLISVVMDAGVVAELALYDDAGQWLKSAFADGQSDLLELSATAEAAGEYRFALFGVGDAATDYIGAAQVGGCVTSRDCGAQQVCGAGGECVSDLCGGGAGACPAQHQCVEDILSFGVCAATCAATSDCRAEQACKWFWSGRACGLRGIGANGDACLTFEDCGGQRACLTDWPDGYCARLGCASDADCQEADVFCGAHPSISPQQACIRRCGGANGDCRAGYTCASVIDAAGAAQVGCVPL
jgi:hypothetical protein